ncbi:hypothetical protein EFNM313_0252 [Enterococcus faecalis]|nr:hypothetical protein EFNM313_0252 [Enterococcus faecalis]OSH43273.1 hypothetical protein YM116_0070 [Enterococcus faecalis]
MQERQIGCQNPLLIKLFFKNKAVNNFHLFSEHKAGDP